MPNENENGNGNKPPGTKIEEPVYIMSPHPAAVVASSGETVDPGEPTVAEESLSDLIQQAVDGLRSELKAELQQELKGGSELNVKG